MEYSNGLKYSGPILISWPVVGLVAIVVFRERLLAFMNQFSGENVKRVKIGRDGLELERVIVGRSKSDKDRQSYEIT